MISFCYVFSNKIIIHFQLYLKHNYLWKVKLFSLTYFAEIMFIISSRDAYFQLLFSVISLSTLSLVIPVVNLTMNYCGETFFYCCFSPKTVFSVCVEHFCRIT